MDTALDIIKKRLALVNRTNFDVIYFLVKNGNIEYVGKTRDEYRRLYEHRRGKDFDTMFSYDVPRDKLGILESAFITVLNPRLNINGHILLSCAESTLEEHIGLDIVKDFFNLNSSDGIAFYTHHKPVFCKSGDKLIYRKTELDWNFFTYKYAAISINKLILERPVKSAGKFVTHVRIDIPTLNVMVEMPSDTIKTYPAESLGRTGEPKHYVYVEDWDVIFGEVDYWISELKKRYPKSPWRIN